MSDNSEVKEENVTITGDKNKIPEKLRRDEFRFVLLGKESKIPIEAKWQQENNYGWDYQRIQEHNGNLGIVCGLGNLIIVECDTQELIDYCDTNLPKTFSVISGSGKGKHFYYLTENTDKVVLMKSIREEIKHYGEIQGKGSQVVIPCSIHPETKKPYQILDNFNITRLNTDKLEELKSKFCEKAFLKVKETSSSDNKSEIETQLNIINIISPKDLIQTRGSWNGPNPWHGSETGHNFWMNSERNVWFCFRCKSGGGIASAIAVKHGLIDCAEAKGKLSKEVYKQVLEIAKMKYGYKESERGFTEIKPSEVTQGKITPESIINTFYTRDGRDEAMQMLANYLMERYTFRTVKGKKDNEFYAYENGIYAEKGDKIVETEAEQILGKLCKTNITTEIRKKIERQTYVEREELETSNMDLINLKNGVLNWKSGELLPHSPDIPFLAQIPVNFNPHASCPKIKRFFEDILYSDDIKALEEFIGHKLYRGYIVKKAIICVGELDSGKTTLANLLTRFIGEKNISTLSLQKIASNKFAIASLWKKMLNIFDDLSSKDIEDVGTFKQLTGSSPIDGEYKFGNSFTFYNYAKLLFTCNFIPKPAEIADDAYYYRWIVFECDRFFSKEDQKKFNAEELYTDEEMSGLLNLAIAGLKGLYETRKFSWNKTPTEIKEIMNSHTDDSIAAFLLEKAEMKSGEWISKQELYEEYKKYSEKNFKQVVGIEKFGRTLPRRCTYVTDGRKDNHTGWYNIIIKSSNNGKHGIF